MKMRLQVWLHLSNMTGRGWCWSLPSNIKKPKSLPSCRSCFLLLNHAWFQEIFARPTYAQLDNCRQVSFILAVFIHKTDRIFMYDPDVYYCQDCLWHHRFLLCVTWQEVFPSGNMFFFSKILNLQMYDFVLIIKDTGEHTSVKKSLDASRYGSSQFASKSSFR